MDNLEKVYGEYVKGYSVTIDSRNVEPNSIFLALKGETFDGNNFAVDAIEKGASLAVVDNPDLAEVDRCIYTPNVLGFLQKLASYHRDRLKIPVIGLTGSNGKTTTKELLREVLSCNYKVYATQGNLNNHIGVPLTLLAITPDIEIAVIEMGANHIGEISLLCSIAKPTHGIITNIGKAHIGGFGGVEGVVIAKTELYRYISQTDGTVFINSDNPILSNELTKLKLASNSIDYSAKIFNARTLIGREPFLSFSVSFPDGDVVIDTQLTGLYNQENILAACGVGSYFGINSISIKKRIENYVPANNRSQVVKTDNNTVVLDAYNANPSSMELALSSFALLPSDKGKIVILGEMLELGEYGEYEHQRIADLAISYGFEQVILVGKQFQNTQSVSGWFETSEECSSFLRTICLANKFILVKGSRGTRMEKVMEML